MCPNTIASLSRGMPQLWFLLLQYYEKRTEHNTTCHNYFQVNQLLYPNQGILLHLRVLFCIATKLQKHNMSQIII